MAETTHPLLSGPFAPLREEYDCPDLRMEGVWPDGLQGALYRIGPNPQFEPIEPYNPLQGDGMVHAFHFADGRVRYRNRWVRTNQWRLEHEAGRALFATGDPRGSDPSVAGVAGEGAANTHIVAHAGRLLALEEGHAPIALDPETLETLGPYDFDGALPGAMTAHPKVDPATGEMIAFANFPDRRFDGALHLYIVDAAGRLVRGERIAGPYPALVHDFAITERHVVFAICPVTLSLDRLRSGRPPIAWEPQKGGFVGVAPRAGGQARWIPAPTCMAWHTLNAFDDGGRIVLDLCAQGAAAFPRDDGAATPESDLQQFLTRWTIEPAAGAVAAERLSDVVYEYPRIDERRTGRPHRFGYFAAVGGPGTGDLSHRAIGRFDFERREMAMWRAGEGLAVSEPVFAPRGSDEGDGWVLATVFDERENRSWLAVLDALDVAAGPLARAHLDHRVPAGFHGSFVRG